MNKSNFIESNFIKGNSLEIIDKTDLSEQKKFRLSEIIGIEKLFLSRDQSKKIMQ